MDDAKRFDWAAARARIAELGRLLDKDHDDADVERLLVERATRYRLIEQRDADEGSSMVVFVRAEAHYAVPIESISEIRIVTRITALPGVSPVIKGIVNVRGRMTAVHDLASFAKPARPRPDLAWLLIGYGPSEDTALLADDVDGIRRFAPAQIHPVPLSLARRGPGFAGISDDGIVLLDPVGLVASPEFFFA